MRADCPSGNKVLGGGYAITGNGAGFAYAFQSYPSSDGSWTVSANSTFGGGALNLTVYAVCVIVPPGINR